MTLFYISHFFPWLTFEKPLSCSDYEEEGIASLDYVKSNLYLLLIRNPFESSLIFAAFLAKKLMKLAVVVAAYKKS